MIDYNIIIDWLTFSGSFETLHDVICFLGFDQFEEYFIPCPARWFYSFGWTYNNKITIYRGMKLDKFSTCVNISGSGCREIETFSIYDFDFLLKKIYMLDDLQLSRIDLALDVIDNDFSIQQLIDDTRAENFTCRSKFYNIMESRDDGIKGYSLYFGRKGSNIFINIYDKKAERRLTDDIMPAWTRIEIRLRHENAIGFLQQYNNFNSDLGFIYFGILNNYIRFLEPGTDSHKDRWKTADYWHDIIKHSEKIKVFYKPGIQYDFKTFETNFFKQYGSSIKTYLLIKNANDLQLELLKRGVKPNAKQQQLINNYMPDVDILEA